MRLSGCRYNNGTVPRFLPSEYLVPILQEVDDHDFIQSICTSKDNFLCKVVDVSEVTHAQLPGRFKKVVVFLSSEMNDKASLDLVLWDEQLVLVNLFKKVNIEKLTILLFI